MFVDFSKPNNLLFVAGVALAVVGAFAETMLPTHAVVGLLIVLGLAFGWQCRHHPNAVGMLTAMTGFLVMSIMLPPGIGSAVGAGGFGVEGAKVLASGDVIPMLPIRLILRYLADFMMPAVAVMGIRLLNLQSRR